MKKRWVYLAIALALSALIAFTSTRTGNENAGAGSHIIAFINSVFFGGHLSDAEKSSILYAGSKLIGHFSLFLVTGLFYWLFLRGFSGFAGRKWLLLILIGLCLSSMGEIIQIFESGRYPTLHDVFLDFSGFIMVPLIHRAYHPETF